MSEKIRLPQRFQGFTDGALGGYAAGVVAKRIGSPVEVNLRSLPPMERDLELRAGEDSSLELWDGETLVLDAHPSDFALDPPELPDLSEAEQAEGSLLHDERGHLFPHCFTCGPDRDEGDGLRLFMGRVEGRDGLIASAWTPDPGLAEQGELPAELVWAAMDCPTIWAAWARDRPIRNWGDTFTVLARQRLEQLAPVHTGEPVVVSAWPISHEGRKHLSGGAIHDAGGEPLVRAESLLVELERAPGA